MPLLFSKGGFECIQSLRFVRGTFEEENFLVFRGGVNAVLVLLLYQPKVTNAVVVGIGEGINAIFMYFLNLPQFADAVVMGIGEGIMGYGEAVVCIMKVVMGGLYEAEIVLERFMGCAKLVDLPLQLPDDFFNKSSSFGLPFSECGLQVGLTLLHGGLQVGL